MILLEVGLAHRESGRVEACNRLVPLVGGNCVFNRLAGCQLLQVLFLESCDAAVRVMQR